MYMTIGQIHYASSQPIDNKKLLLKKIENKGWNNMFVLRSGMQVGTFILRLKRIYIQFWEYKFKNCML
jgi:hypothetical protein